MVQRRLSAVSVSPFELHAGGGSLASQPHPAAAPPLQIGLGKYEVRLAQTKSEREAACRLRFNVFNVELGEGLNTSWHTGLDQDQFDLVCDHLIVEDRGRGEIVGTYRMQSGAMAARHLGYYSEQEFNFSAYQTIRGEVLELGRASIDREHRSSEVLTLLWRGIVRYGRSYHLRYLIGCSSFHSCDPQAGWAMYRQLLEFVVADEFLTTPTAAFALPPADLTADPLVKVPKLLKTYIAVGARICAAPAWDREFGTMDFLTLLDLARLSPAARHRFMPDDSASQQPAAPLCAC